MKVGVAARSMKISLPVTRPACTDQESLNFVVCQDAGVREGIVDESIRMRPQHIARGIIGLDAYLAEKTPDLDIHALCDRGK